MQYWFETLTVTWIGNAIKETGIHKIACAGGNFQNVKANQKILSMTEVDDAFFCPGASDEGLAVGAALQGYFTLSFNEGKSPTKVPLTKPYFGPSFSNATSTEQTLHAPYGARFGSSQSVGTFFSPT